MSKLILLLVFIPHMNTAKQTKQQKMNKKFPSTLAEFGYGFNEGKLRKLNDDGQFSEEGFEFVDQANYEALGEAIGDEVYTLLEKQGGLEKIEVGPSNPKSFIFCSRNHMTSKKVLVLIHGSGVVRAGQWARRLIINNDLDKGTMLPFITHAKETGWGVVVLNTNMKTDDKTGKVIEGSESPEGHANTVWEDVVAKSDAKNIVIIAHSYGGVVTMNLVRTFPTDFMERVSGVFMTDSVHFKLTQNEKVNKKLEEIGKNYVGTDLEVGTPVEKMFGANDIPRYSAGHEKHEWTSWSAMKEIFKDMEKAGKEAIVKDEDLNEKKKEEL